MHMMDSGSETESDEAPISQIANCRDKVCDYTNYRLTNIYTPVSLKIFNICDAKLTVTNDIRSLGIVAYVTFKPIQRDQTVVLTI